MILYLTNFHKFCFQGSTSKENANNSLVNAVTGQLSSRLLSCYISFSFIFTSLSAWYELKEKRVRVCVTWMECEVWRWFVLVHSFPDVVQRLTLYSMIPFTELFTTIIKKSLHDLKVSFSLQPSIKYNSSETFSQGL